VRRGGRGGSAGEESGAGGVKVSSVGTCQAQAEKLDSPLARGAWGACVVGVVVPTAGAGAAKGFISGRQETRESRGASGTVDGGLVVHGEPTTSVGVEGRAGIVCR
jgi:hypothetical protein